MKKYLAMLLAVVMVLSLAACGGKTEAPATTAAPAAADAPAATEAPKSESKYPSYFDGMDDLIAAAQSEGELTVYGSCE